MNIQPVYITFEQAKTLKEKGFDGKCNSVYTTDGNILLGVNVNLLDRIYAPEQWQVAEWLRQKGIIIELIVDGWGDNDCVSNEFLCYRIFIWQIGKPKPHHNDDIGAFPTPQEAYSAAFDYVLKELI
jgi:hypothetical protein